MLLHASCWHLLYATAVTGAFCVLLKACFGQSLDAAGHLVNHSSTQSATHTNVNIASSKIRRKVIVRLKGM
jgi:hypothetical protein